MTMGADPPWYNRWIDRSIFNFQALFGEDEREKRDHWKRREGDNFWYLLCCIDALR